MKKKLLITMFLLGSAAGCFSLPHEVPPGGAKQALPSHLPSGPITADKVEATNAHRMAEAVWDEMDRDQEKDLTGTKSKPR